MKYVWGWCTDRGMFVSGLIGFYIIFRAIKYVTGVVWNGLQLYKTVGCGLPFLASLWNKLTIWVMHRHQLNKTSQMESSEPPSEHIEHIKEDVEISTSRVNLYLELNSAKHWKDVNF